PVVAPQQSVEVVAPVEPVAPVAEVQAAPAIEVKAELAKLDEEEKKESSKMFIGADGGVLSYKADNVRTSGAAGVTIGSVIDDRYIVEGSFLYSKGDIESVTRGGAIGYT